MNKPGLIRYKSNQSIGKNKYGNDDSSRFSMIQQTFSPVQNSYDFHRVVVANAYSMYPNSAGQSKRQELLPIKQESEMFNSSRQKNMSSYEIKHGYIKARLINIAQRLVRYTPSRMFKNLTYLQLRMINDKAYDTFDYIGQKQTPIRKNHNNDKRVFENKGILRTIIQKMDQFVPVLHPKHTIKTITDAVSLFAVAYIFFILSITISFHIVIDDVVSSTSIYICLGIQVFNALITLNTGYQKLGNTFYDRTHIFDTYFKNNFFSDLFGFISILILLVLDRDGFEVAYENPDFYSSIKVIFFIPFVFKLKDFTQVIQKFEETILFKQKMQHIIQIIRLFSLNILINHVMSCIWIFNAKISYNKPMNWIVDKQVTHEGWIYQYTMAYYFCTVTMTSVGYGDITAKNLSEYFISTLIMLISSGVFGFSLNQIGTIFTEFYSEDKEKKKKLNIINLHMEKKNVNHSLRTQIREYLEYVWQENNEKFANDSAAIVAQLNEDLKKELYLHQNKQIIDQLKLHFSIQFIEKAIILIQGTQVKPHQNVIIEGKNDDLCLYLIEKGQVELFLNNVHPYSKQQSSRSLQVLGEGEIFGISEFYSGEPRKVSAKALGFVNLLKINRNDFIKALQDFPSDLETFNYLKDRQIFQKDYQIIGETCLSCGSSDHLLTTCNYIHFTPDRQNIISRLNYEQPNKSQRQKCWVHDQKFMEDRRPNKYRRFITFEDDQRFDDLQYKYELYLDEYEQEYLSYNFNYNFLNAIKQIPSEDDEEDYQENVQNGENISLLLLSGNNHPQIPQNQLNFQGSNSNNTPIQSNTNSNSNNLSNNIQIDHPYDGHRLSLIEKYPSINGDIIGNTPPVLTTNMNLNLSPIIETSPTNRRKSQNQQNNPFIITSQPVNFTPSEINMLESKPNRQLHVRNTRNLSTSYVPSQNQTNYSPNANREISFHNLQQVQQNHQNRTQLERNKRNSQDYHHYTTTESMERQKSHSEFQRQRSQNDHLNSQSSLKRSASNQQWQIQMRQFQKSIMQNIRAIVRTGNAQSTYTKTNITEEQSDTLALQQIFQSFDKIKNFKIYYPLNNLNFILYNMQNKRQITQTQYLQHIQNNGKSNKNLMTSYTSLMKQNGKNQPGIKKTYTLKHINFHSGQNYAPQSDNQSQNKDNQSTIKNYQNQSSLINQNINKFNNSTRNINLPDYLNPPVFSDRQSQTARSPSNHRNSQNDLMPNRSNISLSDIDQYKNFSIQSPNVQDEVSDNNFSHYKYFVQNFQAGRNSDYFIKD